MVELKVMVQFRIVLNSLTYKGICSDSRLDCPEQA